MTAYQYYPPVITKEKGCFVVLNDHFVIVISSVVDLFVNV